MEKLFLVAVMAIGLIFLTLWQASFERDATYQPLTEMSPAHSVLIPAYVECRSAIMERTPVAICLQQMQEVATQIGYAADFDHIRDDVVAFEKEADRSLDSVSK